MAWCYELVNADGVTRDELDALALAIRVAGLPAPLLYPGSYSDWVRAGLPVVIGEEPGEAPASLPVL